MDGELIDTNKNFMFKNNIIQLAVFATSFVGTSFNPLLCRLRQFTNAYRNRSDIFDINVQYIEANLLIRLLQTILILNLTVHF